MRGGGGALKEKSSQSTAGLCSDGTDFLLQELPANSGWLFVARFWLLLLPSHLYAATINGQENKSFMFLGRRRYPPTAGNSLE